MYAVSVTFLALLYLALVSPRRYMAGPRKFRRKRRRRSCVPSGHFYRTDATRIGRRLQETAQRETDRVQRLMAEIQQQARQVMRKSWPALSRPA